jgi:hypothetical protein
MSVREYLPCDVREADEGFMKERALQLPEIRAIY